jgi:hypothetical protein
MDAAPVAAIALLFLQLHRLVVARRLNITIDSADFTGACMYHFKFHSTILARTNQHITILDFHAPASSELKY